MLARSRLLRAVVTPEGTTRTLRPSISSAPDGNFNESVKNPARAVIALLRSKPNNERIPVSSVELWEHLRKDPATKHMRIHSFQFFKQYVLPNLARDKKIRKETRELENGEMKRGWMTFSPMKEARQRNAMKRISMFKKRADAQDIHDDMWYGMLSRTHKDFVNKNKELEDMLMRKRAALATVKSSLAVTEGHVDFE